MTINDYINKDETITNGNPFDIFLHAHLLVGVRVIIHELKSGSSNETGL
jgi:hypothetical protein